MSISPTEEKPHILHDDHSCDDKVIPTIFSSELSNDPNLRIEQVRNAAYTAATNEKLNSRSKESFMLYGCVFVTFLCACANGYDGSLMTGIQAMPYYKEQFQIDQDGAQTSLVFSIYTVGSIVGALFAGPLSDRWGRRVGMMAGSVVIMLGMAIISSSMHQNQLIGGRFVLGFGISIMTVAAPSYCVEISPPHWRGRMVGIYNCGWFGGAVPAAIIVFGTNYIKSNWSWRLPLIFQGVPAIAVFCSAMFLPESPRWCMANGQAERAREFLIKYHGNKNPKSLLATLEMKEMQEGIELDASDKRVWDFRPLFLTRSGRWRMSMVLMISIFGQFSGNGLGYFNTVIYSSLGYNSSQTQLGLNLANQILSAIAAVTSAFFTDKTPRRRVLVIGTFSCSMCLMINAALSLKWAQQPTDSAGTIINPNLKLGQGALAFYYFFNIVFSWTYTPLQGVIPTESLENTSRAKGMALSGIIVSLVGFINTYAGPIALKNIKNNYQWVFVGWDLIETAMWYFFCVETGGRTIEELDAIFASKNPVKTSLELEKVAVKKEESGAIVIQKIEVI